MFTKFINHVICGLAIGLGLVMSACQPIQTPIQNGPKQSPGGPTVDVLRLLPDRAKPELWLANVTQFTLAPAAIP